MSQTRLQVLRRNQLSKSRWISTIKTPPRPASLQEVLNPLPNVGFFRGGTSKGVFINSVYLPESTHVWPRVLMGLMGSPDKYQRQLNGMGGGISSLSKAVVVSPSSREDVDCEYTFIQVGVGDEGLDISGNCGNLSSMAGIFAVDSGICKPRIEGDRGRVRSWNTNTNKTIDTTFPVDGNGQPDLLRQEMEIAGVSGLASRIDVEFLHPAGARTGHLLPTGKPVDVLELPGDDLTEVSLVDATNPTVILPYHELRILLSIPTGDQIPFGSQDTLNVLEKVRIAGALRMGLEPAAAQPKIVVVHPSYTHESAEGDLIVRALSMGVPHKAVPLTVGLCVGVAARIKNTVVERMLRTVDGFSRRNTVKLRHPSGVVEVGATWKDGEVQAASVVRTGRRLMRGDAYW